MNGWFDFVLIVLDTASDIKAMKWLFIYEALGYNYYLEISVWKTKIWLETSDIWRTPSYWWVWRSCIQCVCGERLEWWSIIQRSWRNGVTLQMWKCGTDVIPVKDFLHGCSSLMHMGVIEVSATTVLVMWEFCPTITWGLDS